MVYNPTFDLTNQPIKTSFQQVTQYDTGSQTFYNGVGQSFITTASYASQSVNSVSASYAGTASSINFTPVNALTASYAVLAVAAISSSWAGTSSYAGSANTSSLSATSSYSTNPSSTTQSFIQFDGVGDISMYSNGGIIQMQNTNSVFLGLYGPQTFGTAIVIIEAVPAAFIGVTSQSIEISNNGNEVNTNTDGINITSSNYLNFSSSSPIGLYGNKITFYAANGDCTVQPSGNISCSAVTASLSGTASFALTASSFAGVGTGSFVVVNQPSVQLGVLASASNNSFAFGDDASAMGYRSIALLESAAANNSSWSFCVGFGALTVGRSSVAIGEDAHAGSDRAYAIGAGCEAVTVDSFAIGQSGATTSNSCSMVISLNESTIVTDTAPGQFRSNFSAGHYFDGSPIFGTLQGTASIAAFCNTSSYISCQPIPNWNVSINNNSNVNNGELDFNSGSSVILGVQFGPNSVNMYTNWGSNLQFNSTGRIDLENPGTADFFVNGTDDTISLTNEHGNLTLFPNGNTGIKLAVAQSTNSLDVAGNISASAVTASMLYSVTSSATPVNPSTPVSWSLIQMNGQTFYLPLYH